MRSPLHKTSKRAAKTRVVVESKHRNGVIFQRELVKCGKEKCKRCRRRPAHGPYWYAYHWSLLRRRTVSRYIGKKLPWEKES